MNKIALVQQLTKVLFFFFSRYESCFVDSTHILFLCCIQTVFRYIVQVEVNQDASPLPV